MQRVGLVPLNLSYIRFSRFNTVTIAFIRHRIYCFWYYIQNICRTFLLSFIRFFPLAFSHPLLLAAFLTGPPYSPEPIWISPESYTSYSLHTWGFFFFEISRISSCGSHFKFSGIIKLVHGFEWTKIRKVI